MTKYEKDDRGPLDLTRQIGELQCEIEAMELPDARRANSPEMKAAKEEINDLKNKIADFEETLNSRDYTRQHDYKFLVGENNRLEQERNELIIDNRKLAQQIDDQVNRLRKSGM